MSTGRPGPGLHAIRMGKLAAAVAVSLLFSVIWQVPTSVRAQDTAHSEKVALDEFKQDMTSFSTSLGGAFTTGNAQSMQVTAGSAFSAIRGHHALDFSVDFAWGRANPTPAESSSMVDTARNLRSRARYALFLSPMDALFVGGQYRWDTFAGLDARLQGQFGYMRNFMAIEKMRIWGELGYDLTYENYDPDPLPDPDNPGMVLDGEKYLHSARIFLGYDNQINPMMVVAMGIEGLINVVEPGDSRINGDLALRSVVVDRLQLELRLTILSDTKPASKDLAMVDGIAKLNLIYTLI